MYHVVFTNFGQLNFTGTFWKNPQYLVTLKEEDESGKNRGCTLLVALLQRPKKVDARSGKPKLLSLGFTLFPVSLKLSNIFFLTFPILEIVL